jgi:hypothetical protein
MLIAAAVVTITLLVPSEALAAVGTSLIAPDPGSLKSVLVQASGGLAAVHAAADAISRPDHDAAVAKARAEGEAAGKSAAEAAARAHIEAAVAAAKADGKADGAVAERERILGIEANALPGHEKLVAELKADGKTSPAEAAVRILQAQKAAGAQQLRALKDVETVTGGGKVPAAPAAGGAPAEKKPEATTPEALKAEYEASETLRAEFPTAESYVAFKRASADGRVKIHGGRAG